MEQKDMCKTLVYYTEHEPMSYLHWQQRRRSFMLMVERVQGVPMRVKLALIAFSPTPQVQYADTGNSFQ
jgi:hypothetical protein